MGSGRKGGPAERGHKNPKKGKKRMENWIGEGEKPVCGVFSKFERIKNSNIWRLRAQNPQGGKIFV